MVDDNCAPIEIGDLFRIRWGSDEIRGRIGEVIETGVKYANEMGSDWIGVRLDLLDGKHVIVAGMAGVVIGKWSNRRNPRAFSSITTTVE